MHSQMTGNCVYFVSILFFYTHMLVVWLFGMCHRSMSAHKLMSIKCVKTGAQCFSLSHRLKYISLPLKSKKKIAYDFVYLCIAFITFTHSRSIERISCSLTFPYDSSSLVRFQSFFLWHSLIMHSKMNMNTERCFF